MGQDAHHFVEAGNLKVQDGTILHQPLHDRWGRTKQFELNTMFAGPALEKRKHPEAATANRFHFRKIQGNDARGCSRRHNIAKLEDGVAPDDPAFALNDGQVTQVLDVYGQHKILPR
jgi:hypothetical protein